jgi:hypothetical protein
MSKPIPSSVHPLTCRNTIQLSSMERLRLQWGQWLVLFRNTPPTARQSTTLLRNTLRDRLPAHRLLHSYTNLGKTYRCLHIRQEVWLLTHLTDPTLA